MNSLSPRLLLLALLALLFLTAITYQSSLNNSFHFDDRPNITANRAIQIDRLGLDELSTVITNAYLPQRILPNLSFAIDWWRGGGNPTAFQFTNLCIHLLNTLLVFGLLLMIFATAAENQKQRLLAAFFAAAIWALHPIQVQSVTYIVQRMNSMAVLFMLLSVLAYLYARLHARRPAVWFVVSLFSFLCGAISKENAWITPLLILLAEFAVCRSDTRLCPRIVDKFLLALPCLVGLYLVIDLVSQAGPFYHYLQRSYLLRDFSMSERLLTQPRVILFHLSQILWPLPDRFSIEHDFITSTGLLAPPSTLPALLTVIIACISGVFALLKPRSRLLGFFILWIPISLIIESSFIPLEMLFEHRLYLPMFGLCGLFGLGFIWLSARSARLNLVSQLLALVIVVALMLATTTRLPVWASEMALVRQALKHAPDSARVWNNLGTLEQNAGQHAEALEAFNQAIKVDPDYALSYKNRGTFYLQQLARPTAALSDLDRAIALQPDLVIAWLERGNVRAAMGQKQLAAEDYSEAIRRKPDFALAYNNRGLLFLQAGDAIAALQDFDRSIHYDNRYQPAYANRATALLLMRDFIGASEGFRTALEMQPGDAAAQYHLGISLQALGDQDQAVRHFKRACELHMQKACQFTKSPD